MVLFEFHRIGIAVAEFECDAPWAIYMYRIALWIVAVKPMKVDLGDVHLSNLSCAIEMIQSQQDALVESRIDSGFSLIPEGFQLLVRECLDHLDTPATHQSHAFPKNGNHDRPVLRQHGSHYAIGAIQGFASVDNLAHRVSIYHLPRDSPCENSAWPRASRAVLMTIARSIRALADNRGVQRISHRG